jgi:hypothetical protein
MKDPDSLCPGSLRRDADAILKSVFKIGASPLHLCQSPTARVTKRASLVKTYSGAGITGCVNKRPEPEGYSAAVEEVSLISVRSVVLLGVRVIPF